ncbi:MAG: PQQ-binding-like beta-propeller repeat protein [Pirellulales bacterium]|nr:PQQ-binding-like beta-propeller repeat protein [Pirellulales bacterium]
MSRSCRWATALAALLATVAPASAHHIHPLWTANMPSASGYAWEVAVDAAGNAFVAGYELPTLNGTRDGFLRKYDPQGNVLWSTSIGNPLEYDPAFGVALDPQGNVLIAGITWGHFGGGTLANQDVLVAKYDPLGELVWARQYDSPSAPEGGQAIAVDALGASYVASYGASGLTKWDADGNFQWHADLAPPSLLVTHGDDVTIDSAGNILVTGHVHGVFPNVRDALVAKFTPAGQRLWSLQIPGPLNEESLGVAVDDENAVYLATLASAGGGTGDSIVIKLDADGNVLWKTNLGQSAHDLARSIAVHRGQLLVAGSIDGVINGVPGPQPYLAQLSLDGQLTSFERLNSLSAPASLAVLGNSAWLAGYSYENPQLAPNGWLVRLAIPEPSSAALAAMIVTALGATRRQTTRRGGTAHGIRAIRP